MAALAYEKNAFTFILVFFLLNFSQDHLKSEALVLDEEFSGKFVQALKVNLPADDVWAVYRRTDFTKLLLQMAPDYFRTVDYIGGKGEAGTFVNITVQTEFGTSYFFDQIIEIDEKKRVRVTRHVSGAFKDAGFTLVQSEFKIIKEQSSCIIRATTSFKIKEGSLSNSSLVEPTWLIGTLILDYMNSLQSTPQDLRMEFSGGIMSDMKVNLLASEIWDLFNSKKFGDLLLKLLPEYYKQLDYVNGNGGVGTVFNITLQPAFGSSNWLEKVIVIDDGTMTRFSQYIEGGFLNSGFTEFSSGFEIINKDDKSCVIRALMQFQIKAESVLNASSLQLNWNTAMAIANYVNSKRV